MPADRRPNILWFCTDQQRFDTIGALGNPHVVTPTLDRLVREGTAFTHAYCQSPICTPSRASIMSGMYPSRVHNTRNGNATFPDSPPVITKLIADSGYDCGLIGKFHLSSSGKRTEPRLPNGDGFRYWKFSHAPRDDWPDGEHDYADWVRENGGDLNAMRETEENVPAEFHQTTWAVERAKEFIADVDNAREENQPWLLNVNIYDPHPPFIPPKAYADQFDPDDMPGPYFRESDLETQTGLAEADFQVKGTHPDELNAKDAQAKYYAMIKLIDDKLAELLEHVDENTIVIFTSDHGETLGDHGLIYKGCRFYEGLVRVPLIFWQPGRVQEDLQRDDLVELLDLSATILDLSGGKMPDYHQGISLLPILQGGNPEQTREFVRCEYFDGLAPYFTGGHGAFATMHRTRKHKLSVYHSIGKGELYDLEADPWEHENLWDNPAAADVRHRLVEESFNAHVNLTTDVGSERIAPM
ncbi:MAG: sulfatase-like hydrolase/transferase [Verrucomicrobiales bacterium]|nr:sulfatase-like hydrolase/transferase [Verrucomicrobiales bacterium]